MDQVTSEIPGNGEVSESVLWTLRERLERMRASVDAGLEQIVADKLGLLGVLRAALRDKYGPGASLD